MTNAEEADNGLKDGGFITLVTITPNTYKLALPEVRVTVKVKLVAKHVSELIPDKSVQFESIEKDKMLGKVIIRMLDAFSRALWAKLIL
jgi:hypothetical protein